MTFHPNQKVKFRAYYQKTYPKTVNLLTPPLTVHKIEPSELTSGKIVIVIDANGKKESFFECWLTSADNTPKPKRRYGPRKKANPTT